LLRFVADVFLRYPSTKQDPIYWLNIAAAVKQHFSRSVKRSNIVTFVANKCVNLSNYLQFILETERHSVECIPLQNCYYE